MRTFRWVLAVVFGVATVVAGGQLLGLLGPTAAASSVLTAARVDGPLPATDPASEAWNAAAPLEVGLSGQVVVAPMKPTPFVPSLTVQSLANDTHVAFRITWDDATKDNRTTQDVEFRDAVAVMFGPSHATPYLCMGASGEPLHIAQWKADWQADLEEGFRDLEHAYPNFWVDVYPYAIGSPPYHLPDAFPEVARVYLPGWYVGNPFSDPLKVTAVEEAVAEGFGTIATQAGQHAVGRGLHSGSGWSVVITRPLVTGDGDDVPVGGSTILAFAVWDGSSGDVGSRKSVSTWVDLQVPGLGGGVSADPWPWVAGIAAVFIVALAVTARRRRRRKSGELAEDSGRRP